jgi:hypothetical protein
MEAGSRTEIVGGDWNGSGERARSDASLTSVEEKNENVRHGWEDARAGCWDDEGAILGTLDGSRCGGVEERSEVEAS